MNPRSRPVTALHGLWVAVFAVEATFKGHDLGHQIGALALGLLFGGLLVGELRSHQQEHDRPTEIRLDEPAQPDPARHDAALSEVR